MAAESEYLLRGPITPEVAREMEALFGRQGVQMYQLSEHVEPDAAEPLVTAERADFEEFGRHRKEGFDEFFARQAWSSLVRIFAHRFYSLPARQGTIDIPLRFLRHPWPTDYVSRNIVDEKKLALVGMLDVTSLRDTVDIILDKDKTHGFKDLTEGIHYVVGAGHNIGERRVTFWDAFSVERLGLTQGK